MFNKKTITVLGAGNMGTALAQVIARNGYQVKLWNYEKDAEPLKQIAEYGENKKYLPGIKLSSKISPEKNLALALHQAQIVFFVLPSQHMADISKRTTKLIEPHAIAIDVSKGIDKNSLELIPNVMKKNLPATIEVLSLSGPAIAADIAKNSFTVMNIAGKNQKAIESIKEILQNENLRLKITKDIIGMEITGSLKNIYAIAIGIGDHFHWPMNTKSVILVISLKEMTDLVVKMGGEQRTVYDFAGLGDLIVTALSPFSRNRRFGESLPKNTCKENVMKNIGQIVEGVDACKIALKMAKKYHVKMPLAQAVYNIVWKKANAEKELNKILKSIS